MLARVYKVEYPQVVVAAFLAYTFVESIISRCVSGLTYFSFLAFFSTKLTASSHGCQILQTYFASGCVCGMVDGAGPTLCDDQSCGVCQPVTSSFRTFASGEINKKGRYVIGSRAF